MPPVNRLLLHLSASPASAENLIFGEAGVCYVNQHHFQNNSIRLMVVSNLKAQDGCDE